MILYKYFPENINSLKALSSKSVWLNSAVQMNDPLESLILMSQKYSVNELDKFRKYIKESNNKSKQDWLKYTNNQLIECLNFLRRNILSGLCFSSFSEEYNNVLMWSHYASSHTGFCIGYDLSEKLKIENDLIKVQYSEIIDSFKIQSLMCDENSNLEELVQMKRDFYNSLSVKSPNWSYEKEWRLWGHPGYEELNDDRGKICQIYFGYRVDPEFEKIVRNILKSVNLDKIESGYMNIKENSTELRIVNERDFKKQLEMREKITNGTYVNVKPFE